MSIPSLDGATGNLTTVQNMEVADPHLEAPLRATSWITVMSKNIRQL